jgi:hypothetical protein
VIALQLPGFLARVSRALVLLCALGVFAWVAAYWIWRAAEPSMTPPLARQDTDWSGRILSGSALGFARAEPAQTQQAATASSAVDGRIRLMGIAREPGNRARNAAQALFKIDSKRILWLRPGEELDPGIVLSAVDADGVRLARDGKEIRLPLREPRAPPAARIASTAPSINGPKVQAPAAAACKLALEQRARAYVLRPEIVDSVMREKSGWTDLFKPAADGVLVQNPGGTGAMLGLYGNDVLSKADGAQLSGPDDVQRLVLQPLSRNESVVVTGTRGGQPREWIYAGMNCLLR